MVIVTVPKDVYDFIEQMKIDRPEIVTSIRKMEAAAREQKKKDVAQWIKNNPVAYGFGWAYGFQVKETEPSKAELDEAMEHAKMVDSIESAVEEAPPPERRRRSKEQSDE